MAQITINTTAAQTAKITKAVGLRLGLMNNANPPKPRKATAAEVKGFLIQMLKETVRMFEIREAEKTAREAVVDIEPT